MYIVCEAVRTMHDENGGLILDVRRGQMFNLNFAGSTILELLRKGLAASEIVDDLCRRFDISRDVAEHDVRDFITTLQQHGLVEERPSSTAA